MALSWNQIKDRASKIAKEKDKKTKKVVADVE